MSVITPPSWRTAAIVALCLAAGALAFGSRLMLVKAFGSAVPYMDEWDGFGLDLFAHRADHSLRAADFLRPHNEHRIVVTRLLGYGLAVLNGQWDPYLEMAVNGALHAGLCVALLAFARRFADGARFVGVALVVTALFSLAFDWENTIEGFQSVFTLLEWSALGMLWLCLPSPALGRRWLAGLGLGILSLGIFSSGFLAAMAILGVMALDAALAQRRTWREWAASSLLIGICVAGFLLFTPVPANERLKAASVAAWIQAMATALSWPAVRWPAAFLVLQLPIGLFIAGCVRSRRLENKDRVLIGVAFWAWLQAGALAYGRANDGVLTSPRYADLYAIQSAVNIIAFAALARERRPGRTAAWGLLGAAWLFIFASGLNFETRRGFELSLDSFPHLQGARLRNVRAFVATGDLAPLEAAPVEDLPFPDAGTLAAALGNPGIRELLPLEIRPPVALKPEPSSTGFSQVPATGLPPGGDGQVWYAGRGPARLVSAPLDLGTLPLLHLEFCGRGDLDSSVVSLETPTDRTVAPALPLADDHWRATDLPVPQGDPVRLVVEIPAGDHWFALAPPVGIGRGSSLVRWLLRRSRGFTWISAGVLGIAAAACLAGGRPRGTAA